MRGLAKYVFIVFALTATMSGEAFGRIQVVAQVDTSKDIYVGESFIYNIIIDGENKPGEVDTAPLAEYAPRSAGNRDISQRSWTFINGKTTQRVIKRYIMSYSLTASQAGLIQLPSVRVTIGGKTYETNSVQVSILKPGTTDKLELDVTLSEKRCYVGQPIIMTINFYVSADIGDFQLNVPVLNKDDLFYFEDPDIIDPGAKQYRLGTAIDRPVFVTQRRVVRRGKSSTLLSFSKVLIPKRPGEVEIAAASVSADVAVGRTRGFFGFQPRYKRFMVSSAPLKLTVLPLPEDNKPAQFYGLVGRYTISASATPTKINVGDPITLAIKVGGGKYLKPVQWPALEQISELAADFKIPSQKAAPTIENGFKVFTQTIRAKNDGVTSIPAITLAYFDPDRDEYVTAKTDLIKVAVAPTKILTGADLEGADLVPVNKEVEAIKKGLSANYEGLDVLENRSFSPMAALVSPGYAVIWSVPLSVLILSLVVKLFTYTSPERKALKRGRQACGRAVRQLKKISSTEQKQRNELLVSTMKQYVGDRFGQIAGSLTADDCYDTIVAATEDMQRADKYRETIASFEAARYASMEVNTDSAKIREVIELIRSIEKKSKK